jgi:hypothetical protein
MGGGGGWVGEAININTKDRIVRIQTWMDIFSLWSLKKGREFIFISVVRCFSLKQREVDWQVH